MTDAADRPTFAWREVGAVALVVGTGLLALSGRYGYHRDELYFLEAGRHLAWGYPDQPPLVPFLARLMNVIGPDSLVVLRLPSTLAATSVVLLAATMARDFGARRSGQVTAAACTALCGFVLATGHLLSTSTFSLLGWTLITALLVRRLTGHARDKEWLILGLVAGVTLQANVLALALVAAFAVALLAVGPRDYFRQAGPYVALGITLAIAAPYLIWQFLHGFPQLDVARHIADGGSVTSQSRWAFLPMQLLQVGPWLAPVWITGLVALWRDQRLRSLVVAYLVLALLFLIGGGKPYYLSGTYPLLFAAGAQTFRDQVRPWVVPAFLALSAPAVVMVLPLLPVRDAGLAVKVNPDVGETIGWPAYVDQIATAYSGLPKGSAILADNYGQAGAVDRFGPERNLPQAYSGHNGYGRWGPPPGSAPLLAIGIPRDRLGAICRQVRDLGTLRQTDGIENDEDGTTLTFCAAPIKPWAELWPGLVRLG